MSTNKEKLQDVDASVGLYNELRVAKSSEDDQIDLLEFLNALLTHVWWVVAAVLIFAIGAFVFTRYFITPIYRATGSFYVVSTKDSDANVSDFQVGNYLASDYEKVVYTWTVLEQTVENLNLNYSYEKLRNMLHVTNPTNTRILEISIDSPDPQEAAMITNELMNVVSSYVVEVMETKKPNVLSEARVPTQVHSPNTMRNTALGAVLGGFLSVLIIFIFFMLDDKVKTPDDALKYTGLHTLAIIPRPDEDERSLPKRRSSKGFRAPRPSF
jgi:capsular polysaccharide biosynthesis protein